MFLKTLSMFSITAALLFSTTLSAQTIDPLTAKGNTFVNSKGESVRLWGVNLVALYPSKEQAEQIANDLATHQINLARPHHMMRPSRDWVWGSKVSTLNDYESGNTQKPNADAWDRFDYLNAKLREKGIYLMFAARWSRTYLPYDVDVLKTSEADEAAWIMAMDELNKRHWKKSIDARKLLPLVDERCEILDHAFIKQTLTHLNPYTKLRYVDDPQVITYELTNEYSTDYVLICHNDLPQYFQQKLVNKWETFAKAHGVSKPGDLYQPKSDQHKQVRADFFRSLDEGYLIKTKAMMRELGYKGAVTFSNLWRGDAALQMHDEHADYIEDHAYVNPRVADGHQDFIYDKAKTMLADKPFILGEFNESEGGRVKTEGPYRSQLMLAAAAYGVHQGIDGIVWFAWQHGDRDLTPQGTAKKPGREPHIGTMVADEMMRDHLRTCGMIYRNELVDPAKEQIQFAVGKPHLGADYNALMKPTQTYKPGWQSVHAFGKTFDTPPTTQMIKPWMRSEPSNLVVSDTNQITKDIDNKQLRIIAPKVEAFSGDMTGNTIEGNYHHLTLGNQPGFATVILVSADNRPIAESSHLIISRTILNEQATEVQTLPITLMGFKASNVKSVEFRITRPQYKAQQLPVDTQGRIVLPTSDWHEAEIKFQ